MTPTAARSAVASFTSPNPANNVGGFVVADGLSSTLTFDPAALSAAALTSLAGAMGYTDQNEANYDCIWRKDPNTVPAGLIYGAIVSLPHSQCVSLSESITTINGVAYTNFREAFGHVLADRVDGQANSNIFSDLSSNGTNTTNTASDQLTNDLASPDQTVTDNLLNGLRGLATSDPSSFDASTNITGRAAANVGLIYALPDALHIVDVGTMGNLYFDSATTTVSGGTFSVVGSGATYDVALDASNLPVISGTEPIGSTSGNPINSSVDTTSAVVSASGSGGSASDTFTTPSGQSLSTDSFSGLWQSHSSTWQATPLIAGINNMLPSTGPVSLPSYSFQMMGKTYSFNFADYQSYFDIAKAVLIAVTSILAIQIVLGRA